MDRNSVCISLFVFVVSLFLCRLLIVFLKKIRMVQYEREEVMDLQKDKEGTPRGGGIVFLLFPLFLLPLYSDRDFLFLYLSLLLNGLVGFIDDLLVSRRRQAKGLTVRWKISLQTVISVLLYILIRSSLNFEVHFGKFALLLPEFLYFVLFVLIYIASSNAFNLTDGVDGLLGSISIPILLIFALISDGMTASFAVLMIAVVLAFLWYNSPPASLFMGDTGSGALGGLIAGMSVLTNSELLLPIIAIIPVIESLSVFIQVWYFKRTHGKRIFKRAPLHHHFQMLGWSEAKIDFRFFIVTSFFCVIAFLIQGW